MRLWMWSKGGWRRVDDIASEAKQFSLAAAVKNVICANRRAGLLRYARNDRLQ